MKKNRSRQCSGEQKLYPSKLHSSAYEINNLFLRLSQVFHVPKRHRPGEYMQNTDLLAKKLLDVNRGKKMRGEED